MILSRTMGIELTLFSGLCSFKLHERTLLVAGVSITSKQP